ncbi:MAG TPA: TorF family putative porin [Sphingomicrobium sp.]|jgi:uncharacterized protein (TIGR02001 family)|nr:TorF family putative porin [Sphingomicrobium sp.]
MLRLTFCAALMGVSTTAHAADEQQSPSIDLSGTAMVASDYRFRGISLSDGRPALQGSLTATYRSGLYATAWASNIDGLGELGGSNLEVDLGAGYKFSRGSTTYDAGLLYYAYPGSSGGDFEFFEPYASVSHQSGRTTGRLSMAIAPAQSAIGNRSNIYVAADVSYVLEVAPVTLRTHIGRSDGKTTLSPGGGYTDWSLGAETQWRKVVLGLSLAGTSISRTDARAVGARPRDVEPSVVATASLAF